MKIFLALSISLIAGSVYAQNKLVPEKSSMTISGTSTMHDWESVCESMNGTAIFEMDGNRILGAKNANLAVKVEDIKSGKSLMDSKTYEAFKSEKYPMIKGGFINTSTVVPSGSKYVLKGKAWLEMAGLKKEVDMTSTCSVFQTEIVCDGKQKIDMTEFDMKPPTAMMGTIKVGKEVEVDMKLVFKR